MSIDASAVLYCWDEIELDNVSDVLERRLISGSRIMLAQVFLKKGCVIPGHRHEHEQLTQVFAGSLRFWIGEEDNEVFDVRPGGVMVLPSNVLHRAQALDDTSVIDVFNPPRQDWIDKSDTYLRR
ncbi:MAG: cupin domain-containing protein [Gemmatimonadota bacterium]|nr:cupin domain-containing protein [Gemmatimonadota bacterium]